MRILGGRAQPGCGVSPRHAALPPALWLSKASDELISHTGEDPSAAQGQGRAADMESDQYII